MSDTDLERQAAEDGISVETEVLKQGAASFGKEAEALRDGADKKIPHLILPSDAFPLLAQGAFHGYEKVRTAMEVLAPAVQQMLAAVGKGLGAVAANYERNEAVNGKNFTYGKPSP
jgi:hypothetical protein